MKKILSLFMVVFLIFSLTACGSEIEKENEISEKSIKSESSALKDDSETEVVIEEDPEPGTKKYVEQIFNPILTNGYTFKSLGEGVPMGDGFLGASYEFYESGQDPFNLMVIYKPDETVSFTWITCSDNDFSVIYAVDMCVALGIESDPTKWMNDIDTYGYVSDYIDGWSIIIMQDIDTLEWTISFDKGEWKPESDDTTENTDESNSASDASKDTTDYISDGMYKVGSDIDPGIYYIIAIDDFGAYWCINEDSAGSNILANEIVPAFGYFEVEEGQYLEISDGVVIPADQAPIPEPAADGSYGEGHYLVGRDILAGEYNAIAEEGESGYWCTSYDPCTYEIDNNDLFEGNSYVTVYDGQYIRVEDAALYPVG